MRTKVNRSQCDATQQCRNVEIENGETGVEVHKRNTVLAAPFSQDRREGMSTQSWLKKKTGNVKRARILSEQLKADWTSRIT